MEENTPTPPPVSTTNNQEKVPNSVAVLVLGILSIVCCFCYGIIGLALGIIALVLAKKGKQLYEENPSNYTDGSFGNLKAGRVCAIIGTILSAVYVAFLVVYVIILGTALSSLPMGSF